MAIEEAEKAAAAGDRKAALAEQAREAVAGQVPVPVDAVPDSGRVAVPENDLPEVANDLDAWE